MNLQNRAALPEISTTRFLAEPMWEIELQSQRLKLKLLGSGDLTEVSIEEAFLRILSRQSGPSKIKINFDSISETEVQSLTPLD